MGRSALRYACGKENPARRAHAGAILRAASAKAVAVGPDATSIAALINLVLRSALARVSKDGHKRDRASVHPSRRRTALDMPISGKPEIGAPPQDEAFEKGALHAPPQRRRSASSRFCVPALMTSHHPH